ncbi:MAG: hypothetical protein AAF657_37260 [Acidobacteriota bacterium]
MRLRSLAVPAVVCMVSMILVPALAVAQTELTGQTSGGAYYKITVPEGWTPAAGLVIWNHGFSLSPIGPVEDDDLGPLAALQLAQGYAVAASSYSLTGWAVFETHLDNRDMYQAFEAAFDRPDQVLVYGASLGGIVTARDIEENLIPNVVGAMPICGAVGGSRIWNGGIDLRLLYDYLCENVPAAAIPGGVAGLTDPTFTENDLGVALNACFGLPGTPDADQAARLGQFLAVTGLPVEFIGTDMGFSTFGLADLVFDPRKLAGSQAFDNSGVDYGNAAVNEGIARVQADPAARQRMVDNYTPTGKVGDVKIVSIHTDKDGLVIVENQSEYAAVVPPGNLTVGILVEDTPSHCEFTEAETVAAWENLRGWVAGAPQPNVQNLQDTCDALVGGGLAAGPCRYDPAFVVPDLDDRVRQREVCVPGPETLCLGDNGRFKVEITWEDFSNNTGPGFAAVLGTQDTGSFWFFDPANIEMVVKALDGRLINGKQWIFYGSLTNVAFEMTVTDTESGLVRTYTNPSGNFASVGDTDAF